MIFRLLGEGGGGILLLMQTTAWYATVFADLLAFPQTCLKKLPLPHSLFERFSYIHAPFLLAFRLHPNRLLLLYWPIIHVSGHAELNSVN
jgi:hypothetical protein